jgi:hypothetical protein
MPAKGGIVPPSLWKKFSAYFNHPSLSREKRTGLALALLMGAAVCSSALNLGRALLYPPDPDATVQWDYYNQQRFSSVKPWLPRSGCVGFREDYPPYSNYLWPTVRFAQYVLIPVVLKEDSEGLPLLVDGRPEEEPHPEEMGLPLPLLHDAGNGVRFYGRGESR